MSESGYFCEFDLFKRIPDSRKHSTAWCVNQLMIRDRSTSFQDNNNNSYYTVQWRVEAWHGADLVANEDLEWRDFDSDAARLSKVDGVGKLYKFAEQVIADETVISVTVSRAVPVGSGYYLFRLSAWDGTGKEVHFWDFPDMVEENKGREYKMTRCDEHPNPPKKT